MSDEMSAPPEIRAARKVPQRTQILIVAGAAVVIALLWGADVLVGNFRSTASARDKSSTAQDEQKPGTFELTKEQWTHLKMEEVRTVAFRTEQVTDGNIAINEDTTTPVFSPYSGRVTKLIAKLGDRVEKGAPLMAVEASEVVQGQNDLVAAVAALNTAKSQLTLTQNNEKRQHDLYLAKVGALKDWLQSQADLTSAQNSLRTAEIALSAARNRLRILGKSDAEVSEVESSANAQQMNPEAYVRAPITGSVVLRQVGLGQYINSAAGGASAPVYSIGNLSTVWLVANVRETDVSRVRVGQPVEVRVLAYPGRVFKARIAWVASAVDAVTHRLPVRAEVENRDGALKPMMFASFRIITGNSVMAPAVPQSAVIYEGDETHVWIAVSESRAEFRAIHAGMVNDGMVEVTGGLKAGEKVVTSGTLFIDRAAKN
jgi:cobalt-zinc-cadmium efflux system membrane fusion protein